VLVSRTRSESGFDAALREKEPPTLAIGLGAPRGLFALHLSAAEGAVDRPRPAFPPHHRFAFATPGTRDTLLLDRHCSPLVDRHAGFI